MKNLEQYIKELEAQISNLEMEISRLRNENDSIISSHTKELETIKSRLVDKYKDKDKDLNQDKTTNDSNFEFTTTLNFENLNQALNQIFKL